ncbi:hypothetical protein LNAOJCKE_2994 [Methylorubrum aminovorans]|uniref:Uncharacterized protein n=1 Tax=Methylorubrum aminovorans TaxID=269069 RepID=A0ABQ4UGF9_9HYPH|nr:hypothetical protein [Methylorubrum aminovorans]GJE65781.1 hypothetical protein LNAOJCKE_2994 [Methylorubrum aminovorans]GMA75862.1 hypothetical protein GCM10025880_22790 [Methylorubrum aminovorans]
MIQPFRPTPFSTLRLNANTVAGSAVMPPNLPHGSGTQVRLWNRGTVPARVEFGNKAAMDLPTVASMALPAGAVEIRTIQQTERFVAVLGEGGAPDVEITVGGGF